MLIDFHTHAFPDAIAEKTISILKRRSGNITPFHNGTVDSLREFMRENGIDISVLMNIATNPRQQHNVNSFAIANNRDNIIAFGSVHPDSPDWREELQRLHDAGICGIKLHPEYQDFFVDEERMFPIYEAIASMGFITTFHAGIDIGIYGEVHCSPERLLTALPHFSGAPVIAAHWGGYIIWEEVYEKLCGHELYFDCSMSYGRLPPMLAKKMIDKHGIERFLFASDLPWNSPSDELRYIDSLGLTDDEKAMLTYKNALRLLGMTQSND